MNSEHAGMKRICDLMGPVHPSSVFVRGMIDAKFAGESGTYDGKDPAGEARAIRESFEALEDAGLPIPNLQGVLRELEDSLEVDDGGRTGRPWSASEAVEDSEGSVQPLGG